MGPNHQHCGAASGGFYERRHSDALATSLHGIVCWKLLMGEFGCGNWKTNQMSFIFHFRQKKLSHKQRQRQMHFNLTKYQDSEVGLSRLMTFQNRFPYLPPPESLFEKTMLGLYILFIQLSNPIYNMLGTIQLYFIFKS